jgi:hypothetical protein
VQKLPTIRKPASAQQMGGQLPDQAPLKHAACRCSYMAKWLGIVFAHVIAIGGRPN